MGETNNGAPPEPCESPLIEPAKNRGALCHRPFGFLQLEAKACSGIRTQAPTIRELVQVGVTHHELCRVSDF